MAAYPWIIPDRQGQDLEDFPDLKRWHAAIRARPATQRAYAKVKEVNPGHGGIRTEEERRILFGQDRSVVK
jgi:GST-like protein